MKVNESGGKVKFASAHDLTRSFGERWSSLVMPNVLKELMRHESIETIMKYYVGQNAQATADILYKAVSGNTCEEMPTEEEKEETLSVEESACKKHPRYDSNVRPTD